MKFTSLLASLFMVAQLGVAVAGESTDFGDRVPETDEMIKALTPVAPVGGKTRGTRAVKREDKAIRIRPSVSMQVNFEYDSYRLTREARKTLGVVGEALESGTLRKYRFMIEGHTDVAGPDDYNQTLSERRADAVRSYLVGNFNVDDGRLESLGKGETELADADHPRSGRNRRVVIINMGE